MSCRHAISFLTWLGLLTGYVHGAETATVEKNLGLQHAENPPMQVIARTPPEPEIPEGDDYEIREGFRLIDSLDELREAIKKDDQKIRLKPGVYRVTDPDEPHEGKHHLFAVHGSRNFFDLRGTAIETPLSAQNKLPSKAHTSVCWRVLGDRNTFIGGYFRNILDMPYPKFRAADNEFYVQGDRTRFFDCTFVIQGSIPYGYTDYYGKGSGGYGPLDKHSCMAIVNSKNTRIVRCKIYQQSFGHAVHLHSADGVHIADCFFTGALRPTNDIFKETVGRAKETGFKIIYRGERPIPRDEMIPTPEDGVRNYENVKNVFIKDTVVERFRACYALNGVGEIHLENATALEAGDYAFEVSSELTRKATMKNCHADLAYHPIFMFTRGPLPKRCKYEITIHDPPEGSSPTASTGLGIIAGESCEFILRDGATKPLPEGKDRLYCGHKGRPLTRSKVTNHTTATLVLNKNVQGCRILSYGPVIDNGRQNTVIKMRDRRRNRAS